MNLTGQPAKIFCVTWREAGATAPIELIKQLGIYREDMDHMVIDFNSPIIYPQPKNQQESVVIQRLYNALSVVAQQGFRYIMFYNDEFIKTT